MNEPHLKPSDWVAAIITPAASLTLAEINALVGICGGLCGIAYLVWKWKRESAKRDSTPPFLK